MSRWFGTNLTTLSVWCVLIVFDVGLMRIEFYHVLSIGRCFNQASSNPSCIPGTSPKPAIWHPRSVRSRSWLCENQHHDLHKPPAVGKQNKGIVKESDDTCDKCVILWMLWKIRLGTPWRDKELNMCFPKLVGTCLLCISKEFVWFWLVYSQSEKRWETCSVATPHLDKIN